MLVPETDGEALGAVVAGVDATTTRELYDAAVSDWWDGIKHNGDSAGESEVECVEYLVF